MDSLWVCWQLDTITGRLENEWILCPSSYYYCYYCYSSKYTHTPLLYRMHFWENITFALVKLHWFTNLQWARCCFLWQSPHSQLPANEGWDCLWYLVQNMPLYYATLQDSVACTANTLDDDGLKNIMLQILSKLKLNIIKNQISAVAHIS